MSEMQEKKTHKQNILHGSKQVFVHSGGTYLSIFGVYSHIWKVGLEFGWGPKAGQTLPQELRVWWENTGEGSLGSTPGDLRASSYFMEIYHVPQTMLS